MKLVVSQQSVAGSQQIVGAGLAPVFSNWQKKWKMKKNARYIIVRSFLILLNVVCFTAIGTAQPNSDSTVQSSPVEMATGLRSNGKIYIVVAVLVIILTGLFFYLIRLDRKITRLEKGENS